jgi:hypothetical protein
MADAAYYREYRKRNAERLRVQEKARRQDPKVRQQRHQQELRRRQKRRLELAAQVVLPFDGEWYEQAREQLKRPAPGKVNQWREELNYEDALQIAAIELWLGNDPTEAVKEFYRRERLIGSLEAWLEAS